MKFTELLFCKILGALYVLIFLFYLTRGELAQNLIWTRNFEFPTSLDKGQSNFNVEFAVGLFVLHLSTCVSVASGGILKNRVCGTQTPASVLQLQMQFQTTLFYVLRSLYRSFRAFIYESCSVSYETILFVGTRDLRSSVSGSLMEIALR